MADHSLPTVSSTYANFVAQMSARFNDLAVGLDPAVTTATNVPTNAIRWSSAVNRFQKWNGSAWVDLSTAWSFPGGVTIAAPGSGESLTVNTVAGLGIKATAAELPRLATQSTAVIASIRSYNAGAVGLFGTETNHAVELRTNDTGRVFISATGNVTINAPGSGYALQLTSANSSSAINITGAASTGAVIRAVDGQTGNRVWQYGVGFGAAGYFGFYDETAGVIRAVFDTAGNFGIGTSSPSQRLAVINNTTYQSRAATATGNYTSGGMVFGGFGADASDPNYYGAVGYDHSTGKTYLRNKYFTATGGISFQISTNSGFSDAALIDSYGNLGLGVTPSAWGAAFKALQFGGNSVISGNNVILVGNAYNNGTNWIYSTTNYASRYDSNFNAGGQHAWFTAPSGTAGTAITFTQAMTLDASGNLLVGGTTQYGSARLTLTGVGGYLALNTTTAGYTLVRGFDNGTERWSIGQIGFGGADGLAIYTGTANTERVRVTPAGVVFTTAAATTPVAVTFSATAMTVDCSKSNVFTTTFTANVTTAPTISNPVDGQTINWFITQDATGSRTITWPTTFKWPGGSAGVLSTTANAVDLLVATYRSATTAWYATLTKAFA